jgi:hypothetical protein
MYSQTASCFEVWNWNEDMTTAMYFHPSFSILLYMQVG